MPGILCGQGIDRRFYTPSLVSRDEPVNKEGGIFILYFISVTSFQSRTLIVVLRMVLSSVLS